MAKAHQESENWGELMFKADELDSVGSWLVRGNKLLERKTGYLGCCAKWEVQLVCLLVCLLLMFVVCGNCNLLN